MIQVIKRFIRIPHSGDSPTSANSGTSEQKLCASTALYITPFVLVDESDLKGAKIDYSKPIIDVPQMKLLGDYKETFMIMKNLFSMDPVNPVFFGSNMVIVAAVVVVVPDSSIPVCRKLIEDLYETEQILKWNLVKSYMGSQDNEHSRSPSEICWYLMGMRGTAEYIIYCFPLFQSHTPNVSILFCYSMKKNRDALASFGYKINSRYFSFVRMLIRQRSVGFFKIIVQVFQLSWIYNVPLFLSFISRSIDLFIATISTKQIDHISRYLIGPPTKETADKLGLKLGTAIVNLIRPIGTYVKSVMPQFSASHVILDQEFKTDAEIALREKLSDLIVMRGELLLNDARYLGKTKKVLSAALSERPPIPDFPVDSAASNAVKKRKRNSSNSASDGLEADSDPSTTETIFMEGVTDYRNNTVSRNSNSSAFSGLSPNSASRPFAKRSPHSKLPLYPNHVQWCRSASDEQSILNVLQSCNESQKNNENVLILLDAPEMFDLKSFLLRAFELNPHVTVLSIGESKHTWFTCTLQAKGGLIQLSTLSPSFVMENLPSFNELQDRSVRQYLTFLFKLLQVKHAIITGDFINVLLIDKSRASEQMHLSVCTQSELDYHNFATQLP